MYVQMYELCWEVQNKRSCRVQVWTNNPFELCICVLGRLKNLSVSSFDHVFGRTLLETQPILKLLHRVKTREYQTFFLPDPIFLGGGGFRLGGKSLFHTRACFMSS